MRYYILIAASFLLASRLYAAAGDTITVRSHNRVHMNYYGNFDKWTVFPSATKKFQRIWLKYTLSCPAGQKCSGWDYTNQVILRRHTGMIDSTLNQAPSFTVDGSQKDSFLFSYKQTFTYQFNTATKKTDTVANPGLRIIRYANSNNPLHATDTLVAFKAAFYNYAFDTSGQKTDSVWVQPDTLLRLTKTPYYSTFEVIDPFELMRVITPYASDKDEKWNYVYWADITDFSSLLHDSAEIRSFYSGYSDGFAITLDFIFIEGTPSREAYKIENLWNSSYGYGNPSGSINNAIAAKNIHIESAAAHTKLRFTPTGHGSDNGDNCAEFCPKFYYIRVDNDTVHKQLIWNSQCGENELYPQTGTWIYSRANWCPGSYVPAYELNLDEMRKGKNNFMLDIDFEKYTLVSPGSPSYTISSQLVYYKDIVYKTEASLEEIISPNNSIAYTRENPSCNNAIFKLKNLGSDTIKKILFSYQVENETAIAYTWTGAIAYDEVARITMPYVNFTGAKTNASFTLRIIKVNDKDDELAFNNSISTQFNLPVQLPLSFIVEMYTNKAPRENWLQVTNTEGTVILQRSYPTANTWYYDTLNLGYGCYNLILRDSGDDGISWWANSNTVGTGVFRITKVSPNTIIRNFSGDFGSSLRFNFMAGSALAIQQVHSAPVVDIYPNPGSTRLTVNMHHNGSTLTRISIMNLQGQVIMNQSGFDNEIKFDTGALPPSVYLIMIESDTSQLVKKWVKE